MTRILISALMMALAVTIALLTLYGCAQSQTASDPARTTFALVDYSPQFSQSLAAELRGAPPEIKTAISDYVKLRCAIKPEMQICRDLQR